MLLKNGVDLWNGLVAFLSAKENYKIIIPFIKTSKLKEILLVNPTCSIVIVRWQPKDLVTGASDPEIFDLCEQFGIKLYRNSRIHLKAFIGIEDVLLGSMNISERALSLNPLHGNHEIAATIKMDISDQVYFKSIELESELITQEKYESIRDQVELMKTRISSIADLDEIPEDFEMVPSDDSSFLISSLPMSDSPGVLKRFYINQQAFSDSSTRNCAIHDLANYKISPGLSEEEFEMTLRDQFLGHPFIKAFLSDLEKEREFYFGRVKEWFQSHTSTVPIPRRWELTENVQILYRWIEYFGDRYIVDRPRYSQRIRIIDL